MTKLFMVGLLVVVLFLVACARQADDSAFAGHALAIGCVDTDNGQDYYVKGTATDTSSTKVDYCFGAEKKNVFEYYCDKGQIKSSTFICPAGCKEGACLPDNEIKCNDQDKTYDPYVMNKGDNFNEKSLDTKSSVTGINPNTGEITTYEDHCADKTFGSLDGIVMEGYCIDKNQFGWSGQPCPGNKVCENGACVQRCIDPDKSYAPGKGYYDDPINGPKTGKGYFGNFDGDSIMKATTVYGLIFDSNGKGSHWGNKKDVCNDNTHVKEALCGSDNKGAGYAIVSCPAGMSCKEGACVKESLVMAGGILGILKVDTNTVNTLLSSKSSPTSPVAKTGLTYSGGISKTSGLSKSTAGITSSKTTLNLDLCSDLIQDKDEIDVDCGGSCKACSEEIASKPRVYAYVDVARKSLVTTLYPKVLAITVSLVDKNGGTKLLKMIGSNNPNGATVETPLSDLGVQMCNNKLCKDTMIRVDYQLAGSSTVKSFDLWAYNCWKVDGLTYQEPTTWTNHWVGDCEGKMDTTGSTFCADLEGTTNVDVKGYVRTVYEEYGYINANIYPDSCAGSTMINDATCINNEIKFLILGCKHNSKYYDGKGKGESCVVDQGICQ